MVRNVRFEPIGLCVTPIAAGLENLGWMENTQTNQLILVAIITCLGTASAASGVGKGVRILSEANVMASIFLLALFIILEPTAFLLGVTISGFGDYISNVIPMGSGSTAIPMITGKAGGPSSIGAGGSAGHLL